MVFPHVITMIFKASTRSNNPLAAFGRIHSKARGRSHSLEPGNPGLHCDKALEIGLGLGPSDPRLDSVKP